MGDLLQILIKGNRELLTKSKKMIMSMAGFGFHQMKY
jgi:hypothetical protein